MVATRATLPDLNPLDQEALKAILLTTYGELIAAQEQLLVKEEQLLSRVHEIEHLKLLIAKLRRLQFGRKSEKVERQIEQLELKLEDLEAHRVGSLQPASRGGRVRTHSYSEDSPSPSRASAARDQDPRTCGTSLPGVRRHAEEARRRCLRGSGMGSGQFQGDPPCASEAVLRGMRQDCASSRTEPPDRSRSGRTGTPGACTYFEVCDHLPLYRQSEIYAREGVELERSTLAKWVGEASHLLAPLVEALRRYVMSADKLHADDTPVPVLAPGNGKTKTGRLWTYVVTIVRRVRTRLQRLGSPTRPTARANIRSGI